MLPILPTRVREATVALLVACSQLTMVSSIGEAQRVEPAGIVQHSIAARPASRADVRTCRAAMQLGGVVLGLGAGILVARNNEKWAAKSPFRITALWLGYALSVVGGYATGSAVSHKLC